MSVSFTKAPAASVNDVCGICLGQIRRDIYAHRNNRGEFIHHFHGRCIRAWMHRQPICPHDGIPATITAIPEPRPPRERQVRAVIQPPEPPPAEVHAGAGANGLAGIGGALFGAAAPHLGLHTAAVVALAGLGTIVVIAAMAMRNCQRAQRR